MKRLLRATVALAVLAAAGVGAWLAWRSGAVSPVQRGYRTADAHGCFACHGPGGLSGFEDPSNKVGAVPTFTRAMVESYARSEGEIREWILDGMPRRLREEGEADPDPPPLRMPAFRDVLAPREVDDLVAYVVAASDFHAPDDGPLAAGREAAARLGCVTCHGPQGRGSPPNPGSFRGHIPAWDGGDFADLARNDDEMREWILDGSPRRLRENALARFFLARQKIQMPSFRGRIDTADLEKLVSYVRALRTKPPAR